MQSRFLKLVTGFVFINVLFSVLVVSPRNAFSEEIIALSETGKLVRFDSDTPSTIISSVAISGLAASDTIKAIDFRPSTGELYGVSSGSRMYVLNPTTGAATQVGSGQFSTLITGTNFGTDFNPTVDRIRVVSDSAQNSRLNPLTGTFANADTTLAYAATDTKAGTTPKIVSAAYNNNFSGSTATTLFALDSTQNSLVRVGGVNGSISPNTGALFTLSTLSIDVPDTVGFDISGLSGTGYIALTLTGNTTSSLYEINVVTGALSPAATIAGEKVVDIAIPTPPVTPIWVSQAGPTLVRINAEAPSLASSSLTVTGLQGGEAILGIDFRPANGALYILGSTSRIYTVNLSTGVATEVGTGPFTPTLTGTDFGFDFNPTVDRIRVVSDSGQNLRLNPTTGAVAATDTNLAFANGDASFGLTPNVVGAAYTNSFSGATTTTLYAFDSGTDDLVTINPPNNGTLNTVGDSGQTLSGVTGLDIPSNAAFGYAVNGTSFFGVSLTNGSFISLGTLGATTEDLAVAPTPQIGFSAATTSVREGAGTVTLTVNRTGSTSGTSYVTYTTTAGTATSSDFTSRSGQLTFLDGESSKTLVITLTDDSLAESSETFTVTLSNPSGAALTSTTTNTVTIIDSDVTGTILDKDGAGVSGVTVSDGTRTATTDSTGAYVLQNLPNGAATLTPTLTGRIFSPTSSAITVSDASTTGQNFTLVGSATDIDNDGFSNDVETAAGSDPSLSTSTPFGGSAPGTAKSIARTKLAIGLNFVTAARDTVSLTGELAIPQSTGASGKKLVLDIGGIVKGVTLNGSGNGSTTGVKVALRRIDGKNARNLVVTFKNGNFDTSLTDEGLTNSTLSKASRTVVVKVFFNNVLYQFSKKGRYTSIADRSGSFQ